MNLLAHKNSLTGSRDEASKISSYFSFRIENFN